VSFDFSYVYENYKPGMINHPTPKIPRGLCDNHGDHDPHMHESTALGWFLCHADQTKRLPFATEQKGTDEDA
jgi:hypothetical protein